MASRAKRSGADSLRNRSDDRGGGSAFIAAVLCGGIVLSFAFLVVPSAWGGGEQRNGHALVTPTAQFLYREGGEVNLERPGIKAFREGIVYPNEGLVLKEGLNSYLRLSLRKRLNSLETQIEPLVSVNGEEIHRRLHKGYLRFLLPSLSIDVGKESLWWGEGVRGGLFLTSYTEPLPMIRLFNPDPYTLPGILDSLGPFHFDLFISRLEEDRVVARPYFQGTRLSFQPNAVLRVGLIRTIIMGGEGRPITPSRLWMIWFGENRERDTDLSNSLAGIEVSLRFPSIRFYGELGGEDEAGGLPSQAAYLIGMKHDDIWKGGDFQIEYADLTHPAWYVHSVYQSGYTYKGRILGHPVGGGGRDLYLEQGMVKQENFQAKIMLDYEERGVSIETTRERRYQVGTHFTFQAGFVTVPSAVQTGFIYQWVRNAAYQKAAREENFLVSVALTAGQR